MCLHVRLKLESGSLQDRQVLISKRVNLKQESLMYRSSKSLQFKSGSYRCQVMLGSICIWCGSLYHI